MFLVSYEDHGAEYPENIATAESMNAAKACIESELDIELDDSDYETDERGRTIVLLGDSQYAIEALKHWS